MKTDFKPGAAMSLTREPALPSKCINCNFSADGKREFLDTGASEDYYGAIVFCIDCCREMATSLGYITPYDRDDAVEKMTVAVQEAVLAKEKLKAWETIVNEYGFDNLDKLIEFATRVPPSSVVGPTTSVTTIEPDSFFPDGSDLSKNPDYGPDEPTTKF